MPQTLRFATLGIALLASISAAAQSWTDPTTWSHVKPGREVREVVYAAPTDALYDAKMQAIDIYVNAAATGAHRTPVLVYMHGGAWIRGNRPASYGGFKAWLAAGFSVVNVEYRLGEAAPAPASVQDVRCVLSWIKKNAAAYNFDTDKVVTYGTSAGGHLALLAAILPKNNDIDLPGCKDQPHIAAVLDFYGPYHLEAGAPGVFGSPSVKKWLGPDPKPSLDEELHALSPSTYISKSTPPVFQAHGDADKVVPYEASVELKKDLDKAGVINVFDTVPGGGHGQWTPEENQRVQLDSLRFLQSVHVIP